jgi:dihydroorotase
LLDASRDLRIVDGIISEVGEHLAPAQGETLVDAVGAIVAPGFADLHVHLREPGFPEKETVATGTEAAVHGGFTSVACMPNTKPALDSPATLRALSEVTARDARCHVYPIGAITLGREGRETSDFAALAQAGAVAFSDDGDPVRDAHVLRDAALRARNVPGVFISHCDDPEEEYVIRDLQIAYETGKPWHIAHLSTAAALDAIRRARENGTVVTCEVTPHHLLVTAENARTLGPGTRVNPPLRSEADVAAVRAAVYDGTINALATDHAPHTMAEKNGESGLVPPGFTGLEIALGAYLRALPDLPLLRLVEMLSTNPAKILGIPGGTLCVGAPADVTIFAYRDWVVDPSAFASKGKWTPFAGRHLPAKILATIVSGEVRYACHGAPSVSS